MFWGLNLKPNRKYSQTTTKAFHISSAALDSATSEAGGTNQIYINTDNQKFLVCTLRKDICENMALDLNFDEGEEICFQSVGSGSVTLTGYLEIEPPMDFMNGDEDDSEEEMLQEDLRNKLEKKKAKKSKLDIKEDEDDDDEEDDEDDSLLMADGTLDGEAEESGSEEDDDEEEDDEDDDEEDDDEDEESDEEVKPPQAKQAKLDKNQKPKQQQNGSVKEKTMPVAAVPKEKSKKEKKKEKQQQQQPQKPAGGERTVTGGVKVEDVRMGNGPEVKTGKRAAVYYEGRLKSNNKVFDSLKKGPGFKFTVGGSEVIKGWDVGVVGMKVGGKRRLIIPPHMAYGARGSPPTIPPNSTLVFEVELKSVN